MMGLAHGKLKEAAARLTLAEGMLKVGLWVPWYVVGVY